MTLLIQKVFAYFHLKLLFLAQNSLTFHPEFWPKTRPIELVIQNIDGFTLNEIERLLGAPMPEIARKQALSPVSFGGLGLQSAMDNTRHQFLYGKGLESFGQQLCNLRGLPKPPVPTKIQPPNGAKTKLERLVRTALEGDRTLIEFYMVKKLHYTSTERVHNE